VYLLFLQISNMTFGMADQNPVRHMRFYLKADPSKAVQYSEVQTSKILPQNYLDKVNKASSLPT